MGSEMCIRDRPSLLKVPLSTVQFEWEGLLPTWTDYTCAVAIGVVCLTVEAAVIASRGGTSPKVGAVA